MTETIEYGWFLPTAGDAATKLNDPAFAVPPSMELLERVTIAADKAGFAYMLIPTAGPCWEAWISGAMLAAKSKNIKMLIALRPGYIRPAQLAKMVGAFDQLSDGRVLINLIAGGSSAETAREGLTLGKEERYAMMQEEVEILKGVWTNEEPFTYKGKYHSVTDLTVSPQPKQQPYPAFYLGGGSETALNISAQHSNVHLFWGDTPANIEKQIANIRQKAAAHGRELEIGFGMRLQIVCREKESDAWAAAKGLITAQNVEGFDRALWFEDSTADARMKGLAKKDDLLLAPHLWAGITKVRPGAGVAVVGNPQQVADTLKQFIEVGCRSFCLSGYPHDEEATRFGELVRPLLP